MPKSRKTDKREYTVNWNLKQPEPDMSNTGKANPQVEIHEDVLNIILDCILENPEPSEDDDSWYS